MATFANIDRDRRLSRLSITRITNRILELMKKNPNTELINLLDAELADLKAERSRFETLHKDLLPFLIEKKPEDKKEEDVENDWSLESEKVRININLIVSKLNTFKQSYDSSTSRESILNTSIRENVEPNQVRLPKIEIPAFSGDIRDWNDFQNLFKNLVHENASLSNVQRLYYLKTAMKGPALDLVKDFPISDANYPEAWSSLCARYDNKRATIRAHFRDFFSLPKLKNEREIQELLDNSAKSLRSLKALGENVDQWSTILSYWLTTRLDDKTERDWETSIADCSKFPSYKELRTFLMARASIIADTISSSMFKKTEKVDSKSDFKKTDSKPVARSLITSKVRCYMCNLNHYLNDCVEFKQKTPLQRFEIVKSNKLCVNCFCRKHNTSDCKGPKCKICDGRHSDLTDESECYKCDFTYRGC